MSKCQKKILIFSVPVKRQGERIYFEIPIPNNAKRITGIRLTTDRGIPSGSFNDAFSEGFDI